VGARVNARPPSRSAHTEIQKLRPPGSQHVRLHAGDFTHYRCLEEGAVWYLDVSHKQSCLLQLARIITQLPLPLPYLQANRRTREPVLLAKTVLQEPLVREVQFRGHVGEQREGRRRNSHLRGVENPHGRLS